MKTRGDKFDWEKNQTAVAIDINKIVAYSAKNNIANNPPPNSTLNPETSSDSPSAKSKGARLVSATVLVNQTIDIGINKNITGNPSLIAWSHEYVDRRKALNKSKRSILTSYEMVWAEARKAPKKAYFEFEAHPASIVPYTFNDVMQKKRSKPQATNL